MDTIKSHYYAKGVPKPSTASSSKNRQLKKKINNKLS